jgi:WD40 repeat protein
MMSDITESRNDTPWLPMDVIVNHLLAFLDRATFDACILLNQEVYRLSRHVLPPWPTTTTTSETQRRQLSQEISCVDVSHFAIACGCQTGQVVLMLRRNGQRVELETADLLRLGKIAVTEIAFSVDARQLAVGRIDGSIQVVQFRDEEEGQQKGTNVPSSKYSWKDYSQRTTISCITLQRRHTTPIHSLVFCGEDQRFLISTSEQDSVYFWQTSDGTCVGSIGGYQMGFSAIALSPNEQTLAGIDWDGSLCLYPLSNDGLSQHRILQCYRSLHPGLAMTTHLQFSKDGKLLFGIRNGDLQRWNLETGDDSLMYSRNRATATTVLNRDGTYLARYHKGMISIESLQCQEVSHICKKVTEQKWRLVFSQDGRMLVAGGVDGQLQFWNNFEQLFSP